MPYIKQEDRYRLCLIGNSTTPGELNYEITQLILGYFGRNGSKYQQINDVLGALEGAKLEFYRRIAVPYENNKWAENGDVYSEQVRLVPPTDTKSDLLEVSSKDGRTG